MMYHINTIFGSPELKGEIPDFKKVKPSLAKLCRRGIFYFMGLNHYCQEKSQKKNFSKIITQMENVMKKIVLISCTSKKRPVKAKAKNL